MGSQREVEEYIYLEKALLDRMEWDAECTGCIRGSDDPAVSTLCASDCLTPYEIEIIAEAEAVSWRHVVMQENWMCRQDNEEVMRR